MQVYFVKHFLTTKFEYQK